MLKSLEINGFKSFGKKTALQFDSPVTAVVGPNGSGKSNIVEAIRFVLGEQSLKSLRGKAGTDLIFKGSKMLSSPSRASVSITFDNRKKVFSFSSGTNINIDFDEITISREVYADSANRYLINGTEIRLKDINELLSSVHIGSSGHHIISQGEADRILSASSKDRRAMIEDALGLKLYQYKIRESERKLEKTQANMKEVQSLRREIAPHITFLKKQVEKVEKAGLMREELRVLYLEYFGKEAGYIRTEGEILKNKREELEKELLRCDQSIENYKKNSHTHTGSEGEKELQSLEQELSQLRRGRDELARKLGRLEGILEATEIKNEIPKSEKKSQVMLSRIDLDILISEFDTTIADALTSDDITVIANHLKKIKDDLHAFRSRMFENNENSQSEDQTIPQEELLTLRKSYADLENEIKALDNTENDIHKKIAAVRTKINEEASKNREGEREYYELSAKRGTVENGIALLSLQEEQMRKIVSDFEMELSEARALVGGEATIYKEVSGEIDRTVQDALRKRLERIKIKLEDAGGAGGSDVLKEYKDVTERDQFLAKELDDLTESIASLRTLIRDLKETLDTEFKVGIEKINKAFQEFFALMFGGGSAFLTVIVEHKKLKKNKSDEEEMEDEDDNAEGDDEKELGFERGIEINVSLPQKKVKDLHMLSGGERSLTSIALLFAMSQVNPPPFIVLDETDAALDEANSRKYGNMLENLSKYSQLIVVTHNRETMSRAQVLYGITMSAEGASKLLSIRFDEAVQIAK